MKKNTLTKPEFHKFWINGGGILNMQHLKSKNPSEVRKMYYISWTFYFIVDGK